MVSCGNTLFTDRVVICSRHESHHFRDQELSYTVPAMQPTPGHRVGDGRVPERVARGHRVPGRTARTRLGAGALAVAAVTFGLTLGPAAGAGAAPAPQFTVVGGSNRPATGLPAPESGLQAALWSNGSIATTTLTGAGTVSIGAIADECEGWPVVSITVDGKAVGEATITSTKDYGNYPTTVAVGSGRHLVEIQLLNDHDVEGSCDRNVFVGSAQIDPLEVPAPPVDTTAPVTTPPAAPVRPAGKPGAANTGVPDGTRLTVHDGDINVTKDGTVLDSMDIRGFVRINADDVTIKNSIIRGGYGSSKNLSLVAAYWNHSNLVIQDSTLAAQHPSYWIDGIKASSFTLRRVDIYDVVDSVQVINSGHATITGSWLHDNEHFVSDPLQADGFSHDDNIQVQGGSSSVIEGNTLEGAYNSGVMVTQNASAVSGLQISDNWLSGGACTVNVTQAGADTPIAGLSITGNRFGPSRYGTTCPMLVPGTSSMKISDNVWDATGEPAEPRDR